MAGDFTEQEYRLGMVLLLLDSVDVKVMKWVMKVVPDAVINLHIVTLLSYISTPFLYIHPLLYLHFLIFTLFTLSYISGAYYELNCYILFIISNKYQKHELCNICNPCNIILFACILSAHIYICIHNYINTYVQYTYFYNSIIPIEEN